MKSLEEYLFEAKTDRSSGRFKAMEELIDDLRHFFDKYDLPTRQFIWDKITSKKGLELIDKMIKSPKTRPNDSEFRKIIGSK